MSHKTFSLIIGTIFLAVAVVHALRLILSWGATIGGWTVSLWLSAASIIVAGYLSYQGFRLSQK